MSDEGIKWAVSRRVWPLRRRGDSGTANIAALRDGTTCAAKDGPVWFHCSAPAVRYEGKCGADSAHANHSENEPSMKGLINGLELNDKHMTYAQMLLHQQFPHIIGLQSTLLQQKKPSCPLELQIIHSRNNHWIVCSTINSLPWQVDIYDTLFKSLDHNTTTVVHNLFGDELEANMVPIQKQVGGLDCGPFAIAIATSLAFDVPPQNRQFNQQVMRQHIVDSFQKKCMTVFP